MSQVEFDFWGKFAFEGNVEFTKPPLPFLNCNCQHSSERKILLSKVNRKTLFWMLWSLFLPSKKWTLGFCRILKGSYSKKDWQNTELSHFLLERLKHHKDHWILKTIFACKSFICVRQKHITPKRITLSQCFCVRLFVFFHVEINTTVW